MKPCDKHQIMKVFLIWMLVASVNLCMVDTNKVIAKEYFVAASNGNDENSGMKESPFFTIEKGVSILLPGDILYVKGGTYQRTNYIWKPPSGISWENPITIKAYQNEKVIIKPLPGYSVFEFKPGSQYIIMDGFTIDGQDGYDGIRSGEESHHIRILNSEVKNNPQQGIITGKNSEYFEFINLKVHDNGTTDFDHGFYLSTSKHLIKDCLIYRNSGWGVHIYSGSGNRPSYNKILNNKIYDNGRVGPRGRGIGIYSGTENAAINNLIWGNLGGIHVDSNASNAKIYNNTIYSANGYGILLGKSSTGSNVWNNIVTLSTSAGILIEGSSKNSNIKNNLIYGNGSGQDLVNQSTTAIFSDNLVGNKYNPKFQDPAEFNFHLQSTSPASESGLVISDVTVDFDYNLRPTNTSFDIGAFQINGSTMPPPTALKVLKP